MLGALTARPLAQLASIAALPEWRQRQGGAAALPTFSAYPLQYATSGAYWLRMGGAGCVCRVRGGGAG